MGNRRFEMYEYRQAIVSMRLGASNRQIAKAGLMGRLKATELRKIALVEGWLEPGSPLPDDSVIAQVVDKGGEEAGPRSSLLAYREEVQVWWEQGIRGTTIHDALIRKYGYQGSYSSVRRLLQGLKEAHPEVSVILDFEPGEAGQVDFGAGPKITDVYTGEVLATQIFVMTLCWSRHQYAEIIRNQKVETWLGCHRRAFEWFNGVPGKLIIDNPKCAITRACFHDPEVQRSYAEAAEAYGFLISPCPPRDPKKKGRVEAGVKYIKGSFMPLREFRSLADANQQLHQWILETAGQRIHGSTRAKPLEQFERAERHLLKALPDVAPELSIWARVKVHGNCHVQFEQGLYSVPFVLVRKELWLKASESTVKIFHELNLVAVHPRLRRPGARSTVPAHLPPEAVAYQMQDPRWCLKQAEEIGAHCRELIGILFADRVLDHLRAAQGIVRLAQRFGPVRLEAACRRALAFANPRYRTVKSILEQGLDAHEGECLDGQDLPTAYRGQGRFSRNIGSLLLH